MPLRPRTVTAVVWTALVWTAAAGLVTVAWQSPPQFPPLGTGLTVDERATVQADVDRLAADVAALHKQYPTGPLADRVADVEVYLDAVRRPLKYDERLWAGRGSTPGAVARQTLATGRERAQQLASGATPWMIESGVRGFYSRIDGSAQPYILTMPDQYDSKAERTYRLDLFMHGRDDTVLEQQFMAKSTTGYTSKPLGAGADRFLLQPYGRYSNASRFAGEIDGLEAIESVARAYPIDRDRLVMTGFSMGGASAWAYTVHFADRWAAAAPGAGFTETPVFLRRELATQPQNAVQQTLWHMYDATDYALNTFNVPVVAYSGANDGQKQAAEAMAAAMAAEGLTLEHVIGPNTGHAYEPGARQQLQDRLDQLVARGRDPVPAEVKFTTWMLRYNRMFWVTVEAMAEHWTRARVDARLDGDRIRATTGGVTALRLTFEPGRAPFAVGTTPVLTIDGTAMSLPAVARDKSLNIGLVKTSRGWNVGALPTSGLRKRHGLQGPIDDAFMDGFVFVRPTGKPFSAALGKWADDQADYAISEWVHVFRGEPRVARDRDISASDIAAYNLVLFGDPSSNAIYRRIADKLPIRWRPDGVVVGGETFGAGHAPVFIFPNPLNPKKYVVINSGFTFHDQSNNDMQSPKLPDWAVVDIAQPGNNYRYLPLFVASQGFFDESWKLKGPAGAVAPQKPATASVEPTLRIDTPMAAPRWATLERQLLADNVPACREFYQKYFDRRGYLQCFVRWGANDGPDDAFENFNRWPELHALGASGDVLSWMTAGHEGLLKQYSEAKTTDVPVARDGMYRREFIVQSDWMHHGEGLQLFNRLALSTPTDPVYRERARRFAGFYMNEDPEAANYDPQLKIIRSMINGSRGPMLRKATALDWVGDPFDVKGFDAEHGESTFEQFLAHYQEYTDVVGDHFLNLVATTLPTTAYLVTGEARYKAWITEYMDAWLDRMRRNGGIIPSFVDLDGRVGGPDGKWWGNAYGWGFSPINPVTGRREDRNRIPRALVGFSNALLVTGQGKYVDAWRSMIEAVNAHTREAGGRTQYPTMYGADGWYGWRDTPWNVGALEVWYWSQQAADRSRVGDNPWLGYLEGRNPAYPEQILERDLKLLQQRLDSTRRDTTPAERRLADNMLDYNPATTDALVQLMWGALVPGREGGLLNARLRYFDPQRQRAGVPEDVAALVSEMSDTRTTVTLVNLNPSQPRTVIVQGGGYGEHQLISATVGGAVTTIGAPRVTVRLAPGCGQRIVLDMKRYVNPPTALHPWHRP